MKEVFLMGNEAIAMGALAAGLNVAAGYPGTPSTEVLETIAKENDGSIHVEWSVNEKAAMELAGGAAYADARALVTMKQMGLNVASDPIMCLSYIGVKAGMVVMVADDPGPISSQTEQDTRTFAAYSKLPVFDPSSVQEAYDMMREAFAFSEKYGTPVLFRPTTRICHAYASIKILEPSEYEHHAPVGFKKDSSRWVIFPRLSFAAHAALEKRNLALQGVLSDYDKNSIIQEDREAPGLRKGIAAGGVSFSYVSDARPRLSGGLRTLKVGTPFPFPEELAVRFLEGLDEVLCIEELDPVIERALIEIAGRHHLPVVIKGKLTGDMPASGENTCDSVISSIAAFSGLTYEKAEEVADLPKLPVRPPVLCAGCPHRASFYAVKEAMKGEKTLFAGDIGCYTLGNAMPLDMVDTCLCMGAGVNIAQGMNYVEPDRKCFAFVGDSTFFASAITGVVNAVYNGADMTLIVLDNSTTAMTGHQPHPGTGVRMMDFANHSRPASYTDVANRVDMEKVLRGIGLEFVKTVDPLDHGKAVAAVKEAAEMPGVKAIIFKSPCIALEKQNKTAFVDQTKCVGCKKCIASLGCPALVTKLGQVVIDEGQCTGCGLCGAVCPVKAIAIR